ncbi:MAG TPA: NIPSNAP family protein [Dehalococcoidia bacterium]|nr:NIPSNAP family protein [Dehalococcoidia bacterium]
MIAELRIYTINRGEMDAFLAHFKDQTVSLHEQVGIPIVATWVNRPQNEFIWMRTYANEEERQAKQKAFLDAARAAGVVLGGHVAKMEVRVTEPAFVPALSTA